LSISLDYIFGRVSGYDLVLDVTTKLLKRSTTSSPSVPYRWGNKCVRDLTRMVTLPREQKRATVSFRALWRPMLALEAWAGYVDARRTNMSHARYDDHRFIHDMLVQYAVMQYELQ
nr:hypothetical protein [Tanacetum cinerariifolium]